MAFARLSAVIVLMMVFGGTLPDFRTAVYMFAFRGILGRRQGAPFSTRGVGPNDVSTGCSSLKG
eukprot:7103587-Pyramimonas_sp.AAC.1